jgi:hypothetical protein
MPRSWLAFVAVAFATLLLTPVLPAAAGQASSGALLFYPCTQCHPVTLVPGPNGTRVPSRPLPNGMTQHSIKLEIHDALGGGAVDACLSCHDDPGRNPGKLKLANGGFVDIKGDVSLVCQTCHQEKYREFKEGIHGKSYASCVVAGCHDPHTPGYIYASPLRPFLGTGFQIKVFPVREPFKPLAPPAPAPPVDTPVWFMWVSIAGFLIVAGIIGMLVSERPKP